MSNAAPPSILDRLKRRNPDAAPADPTPTVRTEATVPEVTAENDPAMAEFRARMARQTALDAAGNRPRPGQINPPESKDAPPPAAREVAEATPAAPETTPEIPTTKRFRRTDDEIARGLTVEQAKRERADKAAPTVPTLRERLTGEPTPPPAQNIEAEAKQIADEAFAPAISTPEQLEAMAEKLPPPPPSAPEVKGPAETIRRSIPVLFVNCAPQSGTYALASALAAEANAKICAERKVADYRYIEYGAGPGCLRAVVMRQIDEAPLGTIPPIMVDTGTPEGATLATDLEARALQTVRGFR